MRRVRPAPRRCRCADAVPARWRQRGDRSAGLHDRARLDRLPSALRRRGRALLEAAHGCIHGDARSIGQPAASEGEEEAAEQKDRQLGRFTSHLLDALRGQADLDKDGVVTEFVEKPKEPKGNLANAGVYAVTTEAYREMADMNGFDLGFDVLYPALGLVHASDLATRLGARVREVPAGAWDNPAPCEGWVARDVVRHLVEWFPAFLQGATGTTLPAGPSVDDDPVGAWRTQADAVQALLDEPATAEREHELRHLGRMPLGQAIDMIYTGDVFLQEDGSGTQYVRGVTRRATRGPSRSRRGRCAPTPRT